MANVASASSSSSSNRVGKYELLRNLGSGNTATVRLAFQVETRKYVAIKVIDIRSFLGKKKRSNNALRNHKIEAIKNEIIVMRMIKHPNVVDVIEVMATKTMIYIVMEFVNGSELFEKISKTAMSGMREGQARIYFQQLICAVDYFHSRGVCHRDLKPENLMVDTNGVLKVTDFGMSALQGPDGLLHTACGTLHYTAPEVINSNGYNGAKADIWSCGVILFLLVAGYLPFQGANNNRRAVYDRIFHADYTFPSFFSLRLRTLIQRILVPNPNLRISMNGIFEDDWFKQGYQPPTFSLDHDSQKLLAESGEEGPSGTPELVTMNAFEMFSTFVGYGLVGNFFDLVRDKVEARFITKSTTDLIIEAVKHVSMTSRLNVNKRGYTIITKREPAGRQGQLIIVTEIYMMIPHFHMVEVRKVVGDTRAFHGFYDNLCTQLQYTILRAEPIDEAASILAGARMRISEAPGTPEGASTSTPT